MEEKEIEVEYDVDGRIRPKTNLRNLWEDNLNEPDPPREYKPLEDILDFENFDFRLYRSGEQNVLQPQLIVMGYRDIQWLDGERDSFGPLTRICKAKDPSGNIVWFVYG